MLTAKDTDVDKAVAFQLGADDYVTKPFSWREPAADPNRAPPLRETGESPTATLETAAAPFSGMSAR